MSYVIKVANCLYLTFIRPANSLCIYRVHPFYV